LSSTYDVANQRVDTVRNDHSIKEIEKNKKPRSSGVFPLTPGAPLAWAVKYYYAQAQKYLRLAWFLY
jgi:hypothetical protein